MSRWRCWLLSPFLLLYLPFFIVLLRSKERRDPEICPPPESAHAAKLSAIEDHYVANQFSAMGTSETGSIPPFYHRIRFVAARLHGPPHLLSRTFGARKHNSFRALGISRSKAAGCFSQVTMTEVSTVTWMISSTKWHSD